MPAEAAIDQVFLVAELSDVILGYCGRKDMSNLASASKHWLTVMVPRIWDHAGRLEKHTRPHLNDMSVTIQDKERFKVHAGNVKHLEMGIKTWILLYSGTTSLQSFGNLRSLRVLHEDVENSSGIVTPVLDRSSNCREIKTRYTAAMPNWQRRNTADKQSIDWFLPELAKIISGSMASLELVVVDSSDELSWGFIKQLVDSYESKKQLYLSSDLCSTSGQRYDLLVHIGPI